MRKIFGILVVTIVAASISIQAQNSVSVQEKNGDVTFTETIKKEKDSNWLTIMELMVLNWMPVMRVFTPAI